MDAKLARIRRKDHREHFTLRTAEIGYRGSSKYLARRDALEDVEVRNSFPPLPLQAPGYGDGVNDSQLAVELQKYLVCDDIERMRMWSRWAGHDFLVVHHRFAGECARDSLGWFEKEEQFG